MKRSMMLFAVLAAIVPAVAKDKDKPSPKSALDQFIDSAMQSAPAGIAVSPGSLWSPGASLSDSGVDLRARRVGDVVTILVIERASAVAHGKVQSARASSAKASVNALGGLARAAGPFVNLANAGSETKLDGEGSTSRETELTTTLAATVTHVLPNGLLVVEGSKALAVNSDNQLVTVRGVVRPIDLATDNSVASSRVAQLEVKINGKGVVGDSIRRPFVLYRILLGLLPF